MEAFKVVFKLINNNDRIPIIVYGNRFAATGWEAAEGFRLKLIRRNPFLKELIFIKWEVLTPNKCHFKSHND